MQDVFDTWNSLKKVLQKENRILYAHPREIWWCSLGINLGAETNGKHNNFERPVLVLPMTSKYKNDVFHVAIPAREIGVADNLETKSVYVKLTQMRVISSKRLIRRVGILPEEPFQNIKQALYKFI